MSFDYHGTPLRWAPTRVHGISAGAPLGAPEPLDWVGRPTGLVELIEQRYGCIVQLEPGDATRYSVILAAVDGGFVLVTTGGTLTRELALGWEGDVVTPDMIRTKNPWTAQFFAWWCELLRTRDDAGARAADEAHMLHVVEKRRLGGG